VRRILILLCLTAACKAERVALRVSIPNLDGVETPVPGLVLTFLPYDRDSVIASLEQKAPPRPKARELDSLFAAFRGPFLALLEADRDQTRLTERVKTLSAGPERSLVEDSLRAATARLTGARAVMDRARATLWPAMDSLRAVMKQWERATYRPYDSIVSELVQDRMFNTVADTTDPMGWAIMHLPRGTWWVTARAVDLRDPNAEWYWNLPVKGDTLFLDPRSGRNRPRY
jgi:hypothetical protein